LSPLTHPEQSSKEYEAKLDRPSDENDRLKLCREFYLKEKKGKFIKITFPGKNKEIVSWFVRRRNRF
jgi:hypothetical protein